MRCRRLDYLLSSREPCDGDDQICRASEGATKLGEWAFGSSVGMGLALDWCQS